MTIKLHHKASGVGGFQINGGGRGGGRRRESIIVEAANSHEKGARLPTPSALNDETSAMGRGTTADIISG